MMRWLREPAGDPLAVSMAGVKLGDRLLIVGGSDTALIAALAGKAGLTGRACIVAASEEQRARMASSVEQQGVLVESFAAPATALPFDVSAFDVVVLRNVLPHVPRDQGAQSAREVFRVLRPGGRCIVIDYAPRGGLRGLFGGRRPDEQLAADRSTVPLLTEGGFRSVRTLAAREGLVFVEGVKPGTEPVDTPA